MASVSIQRTPGVTGNRKTWTWSAWIKRGLMGATETMMGHYTDSDNRVDIGFMAVNTLYIYEREGASTKIDFQTTRVFRDPSAWYHFVVAVDTAQAVEADRMKFYVNGTQITDWIDDNYPAEDLLTSMNYSGNTMTIGGRSSNYFSGEMSHVQWVDGAALAPTEFGEVDSTSGIWKIKTTAYATPGTNGFFLKMEDRTNLDLDSSSNALTFTTSGTLTATYDSPSNNFATMNPLDNYYQSGTFSTGNNTVVTDTAKQNYLTATMGMSAGKWYWEMNPSAMGGSGSHAIVGIAGRYVTSTSEQEVGEASDSYGYYAFNGKYQNNATQYTYGDTWTVADIIGFALDLDNNKLYFSKNGVWQDSGDPTSGGTGTGAISIGAASAAQIGVYLPAISDFGSNENVTAQMNFGNGYFGTTVVTSAEADGDGIGAFEYAPPTGYFALCTKNIKAYGG